MNVYHHESLCVSVCLRQHTDGRQVSNNTPIFPVCGDTAQLDRSGRCSCSSSNADTGLSKLFQFFSALLHRTQHASRTMEQGTRLHINNYFQLRCRAAAARCRKPQLRATRYANREIPTQSEPEELRGSRMLTTLKKVVDTKATRNNLRCFLLGAPRSPKGTTNELRRADQKNKM